MKTRILVLSAAATVVLLVVSCFPQAPAPCIIGRADAHRYAVKYTPKEGQTFAPSCDPVKTGTWTEYLRLNKYSLRGSFNRIAIVPDRFFLTQSIPLEDGGTNVIFAAGVVDPAHERAAIGDFDQNFDDNGLCTVTTVSAAQQNLPDAGGVPFSYQWSNLKFLSGAEYQGGMMGGEVTITEGTCAISYDAVAVWPGDEACATDDDCAAAVTINPAYATQCLSGFCVPAKPFPSLKE
ncbi:MAG: hypothetical protein ACT4TC_07005 [Myxococcaceae bacterium]